jgi:hypothetical protein
MKLCPLPQPKLGIDSEKNDKVNADNRSRKTKKKFCFGKEEQIGCVICQPRIIYSRWLETNDRIYNFLNRLSTELVENGTDNINRGCEYQFIGPSLIVPSLCQPQPCSNDDIRFDLHISISPCMLPG